MEGSAFNFEQMAFDELRAAQRALSVHDRHRHEQQAYTYALRAHELERSSADRPAWG
jgi:hypothetical protein